MSLAEEMRAETNKALRVVGGELADKLYEGLIAYIRERAEKGLDSLTVSSYSSPFKEVLGNQVVRELVTKKLEEERFQVSYESDYREHYFKIKW